LAINRYYFNNPLVTGPLEFLAGFGAQRHAVKAAQAGMEAQQTRQLEQSIGQGITSAGSAISSGIMAKAAADQRLALQNDAQAAAAELQATKAFQEQFGQSPEAAMQSLLSGGAPSVSDATLQPPVFQGQGQGQELGLQPGPGLAEPISSDAETGQPVSEGLVPAPFVNPALASEYKNNVAKITQLNDAKEKMMARRMPDDERAAAMQTFNREILPLVERTMRMKEPKPPTVQQRVQTETWKDPETGLNWYLGEKGGLKAAMPPKTTPKIGEPFAVIPGPHGTQQKVGVGSHPWTTPDGVEMVTDVDANGNSSSKPITKGAGGEGDFEKLYQTFFKQMTTTDDEQNEIYPDPQKVKQKIQDMLRMEAEFKAETAQESPEQRKKAETVTAITGPAIQGFNSGKGSPQALGEAVQAIRKAYPDPALMPDAVARDFAHIHELLRESVPGGVEDVVQKKRSQGSKVQTPTVSNAQSAANRQDAVAYLQNIQSDATVVNVIRPDGSIITMQKSALTPEKIQALVAAGFTIPGLTD
jgi:hypothetical protein